MYIEHDLRRWYLYSWSAIGWLGAVWFWSSIIKMTTLTRQWCATANLLLVTVTHLYLLFQNKAWTNHDSKSKKYFNYKFSIRVFSVISISSVWQTHSLPLQRLKCFVSWALYYYILKVIDCSSAETFCKPNIVVHEQLKKIELVAPDPSQDGSTCDVFMVAEKTHFYHTNHRYQDKSFLNL